MRNNLPGARGREVGSAGGCDVPSYNLLGGFATWKPWKGVMSLVPAGTRYCTVSSRGARRGFSSPVTYNHI